MSSIKQYDIVFAGAGLSALTLAVELCKNPAFADKKMALIDREPKTRNDRTWCFWADEQEADRLLPVIYRKWEGCWFYSEAHSELLRTGPYHYYMVRGADFYKWAKEKLALHGGVEWIQATVQDINAGDGIVTTDAGQVQGQWVLNSALTEFALMPNIKSGDFRTPFSAAASITASNPGMILSPPSREKRFCPTYFVCKKFSKETASFSFPKMCFFWSLSKFGRLSFTFIRS